MHCMKSKTITIEEEQSEWIDKHSINLSGLVQKCIAAKIDAETLSGR